MASHFGVLRSGSVKLDTDERTTSPEGGTLLGGRKNVLVTCIKGTQIIGRGYITLLEVETSYQKAEVLNC